MSPLTVLLGFEAYTGFPMQGKYIASHAKFQGI